MTIFLRRMVFIFLFLICLVMGVMSVRSFMVQKQANQLLLLDQQIRIEQHIKFDIQPIMDMYHDEFYFNFKLESYQNPEFLTQSFLETVLLEDQNQETHVPVKWKVDQQSDYRIEGVLSFERFSKKVESFTLTFFGDDNIQFNWVIQ